MNIIYIHTHDSGRILSPYGYNTKNDALLNFAQDSLLFREAYAASPTCSPSRSALLTGMYPHSNGMLGLAQRGFSIYDYSKHLVQFLKSNNYHTVLCGIQHEAGSYLDHKNGANVIGYDEDISADNTGLKEEQLHNWDYNNSLNAAQWISNYNSDKPFFMSFGFFATHRKFPINNENGENPNYVKPPMPIVDNEYTRRDYARYLDSAKYFDKAFDNIIKAIKKAGIYDKSIIIFTTDHGIAFPFAKCNLKDSGIAVSFIMRVPNSKLNGEVYDNLISHVDVFPTLCDLIGLKKPDYLQGISFAEVFNSKDTEIRKEIFSEINFHTSYEPVRSIRTKRYKYIKYYDESYLNINLSNIDNSESKDYYINNDLKTIEKPKEALYDLLYDIGETNNLINDNKYSDILKELRDSLNDIMTKTNDPLLNGNIQVDKKWKVNKVTCLNPSSKDPNDYL